MNRRWMCVITGTHTTKTLNKRWFPFIYFFFIVACIRNVYTTLHLITAQQITDLIMKSVKILEFLIENAWFVRETCFWVPHILLTIFTRAGIQNVRRTRAWAFDKATANTAATFATLRMHFKLYLLVLLLNTAQIQNNNIYAWMI